jgi:hypothetical protein
MFGKTSFNFFWIVFISKSLQIYKKKKIFLHVAYDQVSQKNKKNNHISLKNKIHSMFFLACILDLIINLLNP